MDPMSHRSSNRRNIRGLRTRQKLRNEPKGFLPAPRDSGYPPAQNYETNPRPLDFDAQALLINGARKLRNEPKIPFEIS
jgi:hypothetical protein